MRLILWVVFTMASFGFASAENITVEPISIVEWKAVFGQVETRIRVPARVRTGGTVTALNVTEGDHVEAGQRIAMVQDDKLAFQLDALEARLEALKAQHETARTDLERGQQLIERGVITRQRFDQLQTAFDVLSGAIRSLESEGLVVKQRVSEGEVRSPESGLVLSVPISLGSVVTPGEVAAIIGGGGVYLHLSIPERHAKTLSEGDQIELGTGADDAGVKQVGHLVKLYPQIEGGRVRADIEVQGLEGRFVGQRLPVRLPVSERQAILVPERALFRRGGLDFVAVETKDLGEMYRTVVPGGTVERDGETWREILSGLKIGDSIVVVDE